MRKTMSYVEKIISDVGKITSDIIFANINGWATVTYMKQQIKGQFAVIQ